MTVRCETWGCIPLSLHEAVFLAVLRDGLDRRSQITARAQHGAKKLEPQVVRVSTSASVLSLTAFTISLMSSNLLDCF